MSGRSLALTLIALTPLAGQPNQMATLGSSLLQQAEIARQAVAHRDIKAASDHVAQALAVADQIRAASPAEEPVLVRLASSFDAVSTMVPAKRRSERLQHNASVSEVNGTYTATVLNVSSARNHLLAAQTALNNGDIDAAATNLAEVQADAATTSVNGDLPLVQAKDNLALGLTRVRDGKYKDAILPLKSASRALDRFAHRDPPPRHAGLAMKMSLELNAYAERIEKDHDDAQDRLAGWLDHVTGWFNSGVPE